MKKILRIICIVVAVFILTTSALVWAFAPKRNLTPSDYQIGESYEQAMQEDKPFITMFYADWCTYCKRFMPTYKILSLLYQNRYNFVMINAENPNYANVVKDYAIGGFPTIYIIDPKIDNRILISNTLYDDIGKLKKEFDRYLRIRSMIK